MKMTRHILNLSQTTADKSSFPQGLFFKFNSWMVMNMIQNILVLDRQKMTEVAFVVMAIISFMPYQARTPLYMLKHSAHDNEVINY